MVFSILFERGLTTYQKRCWLHQQYHCCHYLSVYLSVCLSVVFKNKQEQTKSTVQQQQQQQQQQHLTNFIVIVHLRPANVLLTNHHSC